MSALKSALKFRLACYLLAPLLWAFLAGTARAGIQPEDFLEACATGDLEKFQKLAAEEDFDPNITSPFKPYHNKSGLVLAAENGHENIVKALLDFEQTDVDHSGPDGGTALYYAAEKGHTNIVNMLIGASATLDLRCRIHLDFSRADRNFYSKTALCAAAEHGHLDIVELLLENGAKFTHAWAGYTPLYIAAENNHKDIVKKLLDRGASVDQGRKKSPHKLARTPLEAASWKDCTEIAKLLIDFGAKITSTVIQAAVSRDNEQLLQYILESKPDIVRSNSDQNVGELLYRAAGNGYANIIKMLIDSGADINTTYQDQTPLFTAVKVGHNNVVRLLIQEGAEVGDTFELEDGNLTAESIKSLASCGWPINENQGKDLTPLVNAAENGNLKLAEALLDAGADINKPSQIGVSRWDL